MIPNLLSLHKQYKHVSIKHLGNGNIYYVTGHCEAKFANNWIGECILYKSLETGTQYCRQQLDFKNFEVVELSDPYTVKTNDNTL